MIKVYFFVIGIVLIGICSCTNVNRNVSSLDGISSEIINNYQLKSISQEDYQKVLEDYKKRVFTLSESMYTFHWAPRSSIIVDGEKLKSGYINPNDIKIKRYASRVAKTFWTNPENAKKNHMGNGLYTARDPMLSSVYGDDDGVLVVIEFKKGDRILIEKEFLHRGSEIVSYIADDNNKTKEVFLHENEIRKLYLDLNIKAVAFRWLYSPYTSFMPKPCLENANSVWNYALKFSAFNIIDPGIVNNTIFAFTNDLVVNNNYGDEYDFFRLLIREFSLAYKNQIYIRFKPMFEFLNNKYVEESAMNDFISKHIWGCLNENLVPEIFK